MMNARDKIQHGNALFLDAPEASEMSGPFLFVTSSDPAAPGAMLDISKLPPPVLAQLARRAAHHLAEIVERD